MEQTKNEPKNENKAAPDNGKPKNRRQAESHQACLNGQGAKEEGKAKERKPLTEAQRLKRQKMIVLPAMVLVFIGAMWLIFAPSSDKEQQPGTGGYNIEMPDADKANRQIIGDKAKAYEQGAMEERQENRSRAMQELGDMFDREVAETDGGRDFDLANPGNAEDATATSSAPKTIQSSAAAYRDLNATLGNFYEQPKNDNAEMDELLERIASLESELESEKGKVSAMDDQVALMEKSYELAAKYMGGQNGTQPPVGQAAEPYPVQKAGKNTAAPVRQVTHQVVSSLSQPMSNAEFVASFSQERNRSFNTAVGVTTVSDKNTISACIYGAQSVTDGQAVKLRLLEPMAVADRIIPRNAVVVGTAKIQANGSTSESRRWNMTALSFRWNSRCMTQTAARYLHSQFDGNERRQGGCRQHGRLAGQQHQYLHQRRGAARLRLGQGADTRHEPVYRQEDAYRQGASESRI